MEAWKRGRGEEGNRGTADRRPPTANWELGTGNSTKPGRRLAERLGSAANCFEVYFNFLTLLLCSSDRICIIAIRLSC